MEIYDRGHKFRIILILAVAVRSSSYVSLAVPRVFCKHLLLNLTSLSKNPPHHILFSSITIVAFPSSTGWYELHQFRTHLKYYLRFYHPPCVSLPYSSRYSVPNRSHFTISSRPCEGSLSVRFIKCGCFVTFVSAKHCSGGTQCSSAPPNSST